MKTNRELLQIALDYIENRDARLYLHAATVTDAIRKALARPEQGPLTDTYVQKVPDKCDRIVWRGAYYGLPEMRTAEREPAAAPASAASPLTEQDAEMLEQAASMLEDLSSDERSRGNCSTAEGASCSAHAVRRLGVALLATQTAPAAAGTPWPKARDVGRLGDMSPDAALRVGLDSDNDVYVGLHDKNGSASIEFCCPGAGGGKSSRTRMALIALMVAMEADNAETPSRDWWALRTGASQAKP